MRQNIFISLFLLLFTASPISAAVKKPLVVGSNGQSSQVSSTDTLIDGKGRNIAYQTQIEITDYCTDTAIATDISTCGQAAINAAQALASTSYGGAWVHFPASKSPYKIAGAPLTITTSFVGLKGDSVQGTFLSCANGASDCLVIGQASTPQRDNVVKDLAIWGDGAKTAGAGIHLYNTYRTVLDHIALENMIRGIDVDTNNNTTTLQNVTIIVNQTASDYGVYWHAPVDGTSRSDVLVFNNVVIEGQWSDATGFMWSGFANTATGNGLRILHLKYGVRVVNPAPSASFAPSFLNIHDLELEGFKTRALSIEAGWEFRITGSDMNNLTSGTGQGNADDYAVACYADAANTITRGLMISNTRIGGSRRSGLYVECRDVQINNVQFYTTSYAGVGSYPVIQLTATAQDATLNNIVCEEFGGAARASNCLNVASGAARVYASNFVTSGINSAWVSDPGNAVSLNAPHLGIGTFNPATDGGHSGIRENQNADTIFKVMNTTSGGSATARIDQSVGTANGFSAFTLRDNAGTPYYDLSFGSGVKALKSNLPLGQASYIYATPTTGQTVIIGDQQDMAIIEPAGTLATLTITLPTCSALYDGKRAGFSTTQAITSLTVNTTAGAISLAPSSAAQGDIRQWRCRGANTAWYRGF